MNLERRENLIPTRQRDNALREIAACLAIMLESGMKTYGREPGVDAWIAVLTHRGVSISEVRPMAVQHASGRFGSEFPSAAAFADRVLAARASAEQYAAMQQEIADQDAVIESQRRELNLERYGTENPTRDQIDERARRVLGSDPVTALNSADSPLFREHRSELVDPEHEARVRSQIDRLKAQKSGGSHERE